MITQRFPPSRISLNWMRACYATPIAFSEDTVKFYILFPPPFLFLIKQFVELAVQKFQCKFYWKKNTASSFAYKSFDRFGIQNQCTVYASCINVMLPFFLLNLLFALSISKAPVCNSRNWQRLGVWRSRGICGRVEKKGCQSVWRRFLDGVVAKHQQALSVSIPSRG